MALANVIEPAANLNGAGRFYPDADNQDMVPFSGIRGPQAPRRGRGFLPSQGLVPRAVAGIQPPVILAS